MNLLGSVRTIHHVLPAMIEKGTGIVINIASTAGLRGYPYVAAYSAAKHAVVGLTRSLALEVVGRGICVNAVCPGYTDTDLLKNAVTGVARRTGQSEDQIRSEFQKSNPQGRFIQPSEVASTVLWLCQPEQRAITGQTIVIDGGESL